MANNISDEIINMNKKITILLADDDDELLSPLSAVLSEGGYCVLMASDGEQAIATLREAPVRLILLDLKMPKVDGWSVLAFVKQQFPNIKVVVLTAYGGIANAIRAKKMGADDFLGKPFDLEEILYTIDRVLHQSSTAVNS